MRTLPASIETGFATHRQPLARCVKMDLLDGTVLAFTEHDEDLSVDIDDGDGYVTYRADLGLVAKDLELSVGLDSSNTEITVPIQDTLSHAAAVGRRYNQATVWIFDVDWTLDANVEDVPPLELMKGWVGETWVRGNAVVFEIRSLVDYFNMVQGRILSPRCSADFGDTQCGVVKVDVPAVVTSVLSTMQFTVDLAGTLANGYFRFGEGLFTTGDLSNIAPFEIFDYEGSSGLVTALAPLPNLPAIGDDIDLRQGCSKLKSHTDPLIPTCATYLNQRRFRGFDRVPGSDVFLRVPLPGESTVRGGTRA